MTSYLNAFKGQSVFLTGHTGFKGSWLTEWLISLGAEVHGYALDPQPHEVLYNQLSLSTRIVSDTRKDIADLQGLREAIAAANPKYVIHLAAQPLVRYSYDFPVDTFATNIMGTVHLLEAVRMLAKPCSVVCVTTDKCYNNREWIHAYREEDSLGGHDPYSASKGAAELVIDSYRRSFFSPGNGVRVASARAGNVIGGGDWAIDRIVPDCIRAIRADEKIKVRNQFATRPWQHVLEPLSGYLRLAAKLAETDGEADLLKICSAFNFGPCLSSNRTVLDLVTELVKHAGGSWESAFEESAYHEASKLNLSIEKAFHLLDWTPLWNFERTIEKTADWYQAETKGSDLQAITAEQIKDFESRSFGSCAFQ